MVYYNGKKMMASVVVGSKSGVADSEKIDAVITIDNGSCNLLNPIECLENNQLNFNSGTTWGGNVGRITTGYIPVIVGKTYTITWLSNGNRAKRYTQGYAFYNENKEFIGGGGGITEVVAPENACYMRLGWNGTETNPYTIQSLLDTQTMVFEGTDVSRAYEEYSLPTYRVKTEALEKGVLKTLESVKPADKELSDTSENSVQNKVIAKVINSFLMFDKGGYNLFNPAEAEDGIWLVNSTGKTSSNNLAVTTDYIPVISGKTYIMTTLNNGVRAKYWTGSISFYDNDKNFISGIGGANSVVVPENACYMRCSWQNSGGLTIQKLVEFQLMIFEGTDTGREYQEYLPASYKVKKEALEQDLLEKSIADE
jgi:hypothetical protein